MKIDRDRAWWAAQIAKESDCAIGVGGDMHLPGRLQHLDREPTPEEMEDLKRRYSAYLTQLRGSGLAPDELTSADAPENAARERALVALVEGAEAQIAALPPHTQNQLFEAPSDLSDRLRFALSLGCVEGCATCKQRALITDNVRQEYAAIWKQSWKQEVPAADDKQAPVEDFARELLVDSVGTTIKLQRLPSFETYLSDKAKKIYNRQEFSTVIEYNHCVTCNVNPVYTMPPPFSAAWVVNPPATDEQIAEHNKHDGHEVERRFNLVQFFGKTIYLNDDGSYDENYVAAMARVFNRLAAEDMIGPGTLMQASMLELEPDHDYVPPDAGLKVTRRRAMFMVYVGAYHQREVLNAFLRNEVFQNEGQIGNADWTNIL